MSQSTLTFDQRTLQGRPFAWQEIHLVLASVLQKFDLQLADPSSYTLHLKFVLTIKPEVHVRAIPRAGRSAHVVIAAPSSGLREARSGLSVSGNVPEDAGKQRMYVLYGSNTGSCESFAQKIATAAPSHGMRSGGWAALVAHGCP
jgi:cytochrome P450/NADPH-cytochrome P450 reductase